MSADIVKSVSIENMVNQRAAVMERIAKARELLNEAAEIAANAHLGMPRIMASVAFGRGGPEFDLCHAQIGRHRRNGSTYKIDASSKATLDSVVQTGVDAAAWQYLMHESGMRSLMDATAREKWDAAISNGDFPEFTAENVRATFSALHNARGDMFERGVIECFRQLSWHYRTNQPFKFGKRIVVRGIAGFYGNQKCDQLDDLIRVFHVMDGKPEPDHRGGIENMMRAGGAHWHIRRQVNCENDYIHLRTFKNGNGHVTFKRLDLVEKLNAILIKHFPGALAHDAFVEDQAA